MCRTQCLAELAPSRAWHPKTSSTWKGLFGKAMSIPAYPCLFPFAVLPQADATVEDAEWWAQLFGFACFGVSFGHLLIWQRFAEKSWRHWATQGMFLLAATRPMCGVWYLLCQLQKIFALDRSESRILAGRLKGPRVVVIGNGPSAVQGKQLGDRIDAFDEVVRFNNFQCKVAGMEKFVGQKTTVHFSDGMLFPTFKEYHSPGADMVLSLFTDRLFVAGSYLIMRAMVDMELDMVCKFFMDPATVWIPKENIERLKKELGLTFPKHPTSGMLAIDFYLQQKNVQLPVYIHGFDFFQGPTIHYFHASEPLHERINNHIGVNMHSPEKEKIYVEKLIAEGKVKFLSADS